MLSRRAQQIVDVLVDHGRREILRDFRPDSCVASTRIAVELLRRYDIRARPLAVKVQIYNAQAAARIERGDRARSTEDADRWFAEDGSHSVAIGFGSHDDSPGFDGHLVCVVEERLVIDLSLDQASRPEHGIKLGTTTFSADKAILAGQDAVKATGEDGTLILYMATPSNKAYLTAPDWTQRSRWEPALSRLSARIDDLR